MLQMSSWETFNKDNFGDMLGLPLLGVRERKLGEPRLGYQEKGTKLHHCVPAAADVTF